MRTTAFERKFINSGFFEPKYRLIGVLSQNHVWLNTVERGIEIDRSGKKSDRVIIKIVRWRAKNDKKNNNKYWSFYRSYNVRSIDEWEQTSNLVDNLIINDTQVSNFVSVPLKEFDKLSLDSIGQRT